jgi:uncharacterized OB-fold protein
MTPSTGLKSVYVFDESGERPRLVVHRCTRCSQVRLLPDGPCPACYGDEAVAEPADGRAVVHSFTVVHRMAATIWTGELTPPFVVAIVELQEGVRMMSNIVGATAPQVAVGSLVYLAVARRAGALLPLFTLESVESER